MAAETKTPGGGEKAQQARVTETKALSRFVRISPRKARQVMDMVRGKDVQDALNTLTFLPKKAARLIEKVVKSAAANAENNFGMTRDFLYISKAYVDGGPALKRWLPRAYGRATPIKKRLSHITVFVSEREQSAVKKTKTVKTAETKKKANKEDPKVKS